LCQEARGTPPPSEVLRKGVKGQQGEVILTGDRILITEKCNRLGIENGDLGTVRDVTGRTGRRVLVVEFDDTGKTVEVPTSEFGAFRLGYAMTTHKGQGVTCKNAFVLVGGSMQDRHLSYVQASRAVERTRFYTDRFEAGPRLEQLAALASQDRTKDLAQDVAKRTQQQQQTTTTFAFGTAS
jgi:ATP-dependent exoDNAse (exonuclease V) alpha subunit